MTSLSRADKRSQIITIRPGRDDRPACRELHNRRRVVAICDKSVGSLTSPANQWSIGDARNWAYGYVYLFGVCIHVCIMEECNVQFVLKTVNLTPLS